MLGIEELKKELALFFKFYKDNYPNHKYFAILMKIKFKNDEIRSCSTAQISTLNGFEKLVSIFSQIFFVESFAEIVSNSYMGVTHAITKLPVGDIIFTFKPLKNVKDTKYENYKILEDSPVMESNLNFLNNFKYKNFNIPATMDLTL
jgi:hypothetical protein